MKRRIQVFSTREKEIIERITSLLKKNGSSDDLRRVDDNLAALYSLAESISMYPSLLNQQHLGSNYRTVETLVENLCSNRDLNILMHTPTKAVLGRSFSIAKINFFLLLCYLCRDLPALCESGEDIQKTVSINVFSVMTEDVFASIISDTALSYETRSAAAGFLARIWEYRIYRGVKELAPILTDLWNSRNEIRPTYGTMSGIWEITTFCRNRNPVWINFLEDPLFTEDRLEALKEYLMGLSFEETLHIGAYMAANSISAMTHSEIDSVLDGPRTYPGEDKGDPRDMYTFFSMRKANAAFREKSGMRGPHRTIEEYIMCYLIETSNIKAEE